MKVLNSSLCNMSADMSHNISDNPSDAQKAKYQEGIKYLLTTIKGRKWE